MGGYDEFETYDGPVRSPLDESIKREIVDIETRKGCLSRLGVVLLVLSTTSGILKEVLPTGNIFQRVSKGASILVNDPSELNTYINLNLAQLYSTYIGNMPLTGELLTQMLFSKSSEINVTEMYIKSIVDGFRSNEKIGQTVNLSSEEVLSNYFQTSILTSEENFKVEKNEEIITITMQANSYNNADLSNSLNFYGSQVKFLSTNVEIVQDSQTPTINIREVEFNAFDTYDWWNFTMKMDYLVVSRTLLEVYEIITKEEIEEGHPLRFLNNLIIEIKDTQVAVFVDKGLGNKFKINIGPIKLRDFKLTFDTFEKYQDFLDLINS